ncbi:unnamed protein product [Paramecium sonneborni]|uniref:Non-specific serine/threonine protein kinase n=1 Tax=Paramecium sonneborni TaxID=65129 RepID=A0A8S1LUQ6_9CILI|nr:unnamed protein product [Paramecium sonneborni]
MNVLLEKELQKLAAGNYQRASDIKDSIQNILFENQLNHAEIGLCSSKIMASEKSLLEFLTNHVLDKDTYYAQTKKSLYQIIAKYIKNYVQYVSEYLESIISTCIQNFKKEESGVAKEASLFPIIKIYKHCDQQILVRLQVHKNIFHILLQECLETKLTAGVKGRIFQSLGLLMKRFNNDLEEHGIYLHAFQSIISQIQSSKPEMVIIEGILKFFKQCLIFHPFNQDQLAKLYQVLVTFCKPVEDLSTFKVPIAACKCMKQNLDLFGHFLIIRANALTLFEQYIKILQHRNRDLKECVQDLLELFIQKISQQLDHNINDHKIIFNVILNKFIEILNDNKADMFLMTVIIRSVGHFARAIANLRGEKQLSDFFDKLNDLGFERLLQVYEEFYKEEEGNIKKGAQFKVLLYRQKQLNSFLISYANIIKNLTIISDKQIQHLFALCSLCIKQHYNYFENYRPYLYDGMANIIISIFGHQNIGIQFISSLLSKGVIEGLKLGQNQLDGDLYLKTCQEMAKLWIGIIEQKIWTQHYLTKFVKQLFDQIAQLIQNCNFDSNQKEVTQLEEQNQQQFSLKIQEFRNFAVNPIQLQQFHRFILMLSSLIPKIPIESAVISVLSLLNLVQIKIRKYPKALLLLIFARILLKYIKETQLMSQQFFEARQKQILINLIFKLKGLIQNNLKQYSQQLQIEALNILLTIPVELIIKDNYLLLKSEYLQIIINSFQMNNNSLSWSAIDLLIQLIQSEYNQKSQKNLKYLLKILKNVIPKLSTYMQLIPEKEKSQFTPIQYIDSVSPNVLLSEQHIDQNHIVEKVRYFLGSIGGLCHLIVDETYNESLLALDYNSPITINIPVGQRKLKIRFGQFLERILNLCLYAPLEKSKIYACELLQAFIIYMIGDQAVNGTKAVVQNTKKKFEYANIYKKMFPIMIEISNTMDHPCKTYFKEHLTRIVHWFANSKQYEAPDVAQLLDCLFEQPISKEDPQFEQFCSQLIGEFIQWTLKQTTPDQLKLNYSNIKTVMRRIITYANHPDYRYKSMSLECILQFVKHTQQEKFIVSKYFIEIVEQLKFIFLVEDKDISRIVSNTNNIIDIISNAFERFTSDLLQETKGRQGKNKTLYSLHEFLLNEAMIGKDGGWQQAALSLWYLSISKTQKIIKKNARELLVDQINDVGQKMKLFPKYPIHRLQGEQNYNSLRQDAESLSWQCRVWQFICDRNLFTLDEIIQFDDYLITTYNIHQFLRYFLIKNQKHMLEESPLFDMIMTLTQDNFNPSQYFQNDQTNLDNWLTTQLPEKLVEQLITTFERVYKFVRTFHIDIEQYYNLSLGLVIRPSYFLKGVQLDLYFGQVNSVCNEAQKLLSANIKFSQFRQVLNEIFDNEFVSFASTITNKDLIKDINELKFFLNGLKWIFNECSNDQDCINFYQECIDQLGQVVVNFEQGNDQINNIEYVTYLFEFLLSEQRAKNFVISNLIKASDFRQKNEEQLIGFIAKYFESVGQTYFQYICKEVHLFRQGIRLVNKVPENQIHHFYNFQFKVNRENSALLQLEIQINNIIINQTKNINKEYVKGLLKEGFNTSKSIDIHTDSLILFGLYIKHIDTDLPNYLNDLANKYFPIKISDLKKGSIEESNFKEILKKLTEMIKLCGQIQYIEVLFPLLRQDLNFDYFIQEFLQINQESYSQLKWLMLQIKDEQLDTNPLNNVRIALGNKLLIPLLSNSKLLLEFYSEFTPYILQQLNVVWDDNWKVMIFQIQWRTLMFDLFGIAYKKMSSEQIKKQLHQNLKFQADNEITKRLILDCNKASKFKFEKINILNINQKEILSQVNYVKVVEDYQCSAFITYIYVLMKTQTKENIFYAHLFKKERDINYWDNFINKDWQFNFQVETNFEEKPLFTEVRKQQQDYFQEKIVKNYLYTASSLSVEQVTETNMEVEEEDENIQNTVQVQKIEMDEVNKHKLMIPLLSLIEFMANKQNFQQMLGQQQTQQTQQQEEEMPSWMTAIKSVFNDDSLYLSLKIFMLKLIINKSDIFNKYASGWIGVLLDYCTKENKINGGKGFHYFLRDVIVVLIKFSQKQEVRQEYLQMHPQSKNKICSVINNLIMLSADKNRKIFDQNIEIIGMFVQLYRDQMYICDKLIVDMICKKPEQKNLQIEPQTEDNSVLWQANGLAILHIALLNNVVILQDYPEFVRTANSSVYERYRFILQKQSHNIKFPTDQIYRMACTYTTKKHVLKGIANVYGSVLQCCQNLKISGGEYEQEIINIVTGIKADSRPGYGKEKFTTFMKIITFVYPKVLGNNKLFQETANLIVQASNKERAQILIIFSEFLGQIETSTQDPEFFINEIVVSISGSIDKVIEDQEESVHYELLNLLKQLAQLKCLNACTELILHCFNQILDKIDQKYGIDRDIGIVKIYQSILKLLHEYLINYEHKELQEKVTTYILSLFTSQHAEIRTLCFKYLQDDLERKAIQLQYQAGQQTSQIDRVISLMKDIYQPSKETLWLKGAVPLLLSQSTKTSEYDSFVFDKNLSDEAHYYDQEFNNKKYFRQNNMSQMAGTQFGSQYTSSSQLLSQAIGASQNNQGNKNIGNQKQMIRATQEIIQQQSQYLDEDGFRIPTKSNKSHLSQFLQANEISFQQIQLTSNNQIRYKPESASSQRDVSKKYYKLKTQQSTSQMYNQTQEGFEKFVQNRVRQYREGDLPDIKIKHKDIIDPLIVLCFEDEELAGRVFTALFQELYDKNTSAETLYEVLLGLLQRSQCKTFIFISTVLRTLHQVLCKSGILLPENKIVKKIGLESLAYYQSMILTEECILRLQEDNENLEIRKSFFWMDLMDLHQSQGNKAQIEGIINELFKDKPAFDSIKQAMDLKHQYSYVRANQQLEELLEEIHQEGYDELTIDGRMVHYLQQEFQDTCMKLGQWEKLDSQLKDVTQLTDKELNADLPLIRRTLHKYMSINKAGEFDLQKAKYLDRRTEHLQDEFLLEKTLILISEQDIDQSRYFLQKAQKKFLIQWSSLLSQNELLSKQLRHKHLEQLQIMHEMGEIQSIYSGVEIDIDKKMQIFNTWSVRSPSLQDSLYTWNRIYQNRLIMANQTHPILGMWALQFAKGVVQMNLFQQAANLLSICFKIYKCETWSTYSTLAKLKLKEERFESDQRDLETILQKLNDNFDRYDQHKKLKLFFCQQAQKNTDKSVQFRFNMLPIISNQHYLKINQDVVFMFNQESRKHNNRYDFNPFYQRYADAIMQTFNGYLELQIQLQEENINQSKFYNKAALFCERCLRVIEPDSGGSNDLRKILENRNISLDMIADQFVRYTINSFKFNSNQLNKIETLLIKVLKVVQKFPNQIGPVFQDAVEKGHLSTWIFLQYLPQLIHLINDNIRYQYFKKIFDDFVKKYPQQFVYQFNVTYQIRKEFKGDSEASKMFDKLHQQIPKNYAFIEALNQLTHPEHRLQAYLNQIKDNSEDIEIIIDKMQEDFYSKREDFYGSYNLAYIQKKKNSLNQILRNKADQHFINQLAIELQDEIKSLQIKNQQMVHDMSRWFQNFNEESIDQIGKYQEILIPMQLNGMNELDIRMIPKIASFDQGMLVLSSIRKPKRIKIYGTDEKQYLFLVKGGEDLRLDQRIECLFDVMNKILPDSDLSTYGVFPMTKLFGMLQWVDNTTVIKDIIDREHQEEEGLELFKNKALTKRDEYVAKAAKRQGQHFEKNKGCEVLGVLQCESANDIVTNFNEQKKYVKDTLLRNGLSKLSANLEAFVFIRDKFLINYAGICASGYILGIGDRHLENILLNYSNGNLIAIDFGFSFGQGLALPIPELMPFRLTQVFEGLAKPIGLGGLYKSQFVKVMSAFRKKRHILLDFCEVFINDPLIEQIKIGKNKGMSDEFRQRLEEQSKIEEQIYNKTGDSMSMISLDQQRIKETWYPRKKIDIVHKKLIGVHCSLILLEEFDESRHQSARYADNLRKAIQGINQNRLRHQFQKHQTLSVIQQVDCLIDLATDPNILGRAWKGWVPFI